MSDEKDDWKIKAPYGFFSMPTIVGYYVLGNSAMGHHFGLTRKPGRIERFFVRRLLGLSWKDKV